MKNYYLSLLLILSVCLGTSQNNDFVPTSGLQWSNAANWSLGVVPNLTNTVNTRLPGTIESDLDTSISIRRIQTTFGTGNTGGTEAAVAGAGVLTIDGGSNNAQGIANLSGNGIDLVFRTNVTIANSTTDGISNTWTQMGNNAANGIVFDTGSVLTLNTPLELRSGGSSVYDFNGTLAGTGALRLSGNIQAVFGNTSDNTGHEGDLVWVGPSASLVVNTADNNVFMPVDRKVQINGNNGSMTVNGVNVYQGNISVFGSNVFTFNANANQNGMGTITLAGGTANGTLNIAIDNSVTELVFADNSSADWGTGTVNITGYQEGVLRFGTDSNGLTTAQLAQITVDGSGGPVALDANGFLVNESSLSLDEINDNSFQKISYPSMVNSILYFNKPQDNFSIFDLNGRLVLKNDKQGQVEVQVDVLKSGLYLIVFNDSIVERFFKN